jgi:hypothetical protein
MPQGGFRDILALVLHWPPGRGACVAIDYDPDEVAYREMEKVVIDGVQYDSNIETRYWIKNEEKKTFESELTRTPTNDAIKARGEALDKIDKLKK